MNNAARLVIFAIIVGGLAVLAFFKLKSNQEKVEAKVYKRDSDASVLIQTDTLKLSPFNYEITYLGSFAPNREAIIASEASGRVVQVGVEEGSFVSAGQLIAQLDTDILKNQLKIAENNLSLAEKTAQRMNNAGSTLTEVQVDNANSQVVSLKLQIELLKKQISMATIKAPFSGIITSKYFEIGSLEGPGAQMAVITDINTLKLEINVPEKEITKFKSGMKLNIRTDVYPEHIYIGTVGVVASKTDATKNYTVKILVSNSSSYPLKAGMYGTVSQINNTSLKSISIPRTSLVGSNKNPEVYVVKNGIAKRQSIELGESNKDRLQVTHGLNENDIIAVGGLVNLTDGIKVTIAEN
ncbi:MAG: efflux RND transporter periplasmic adaptor subunit [Chitinophagales bacterium]|nr:efflux RND transporter periplasmic adaptor subunit [Chitinophagales bacterium]MCZ2392379.1 efflux RND transporter periplasmic adaptor subunit [Chitinophagales bacterium]